MKRKGIKKGFLLTAHGDWGEVHHRVFADAVRSSGGEIVGEEFYDYGSDLATIKSILLKATKKSFDLLMATTSSDDIANIIRARDELKLDFAVMTTDTIEDALRYGLVHTDQLQKVYMTHLPMSKEFSKMHLEHFGKEALSYSDRAYDAVMLLAQAASATDGSVSDMKRYLRSSSLEPGITGPMVFDTAGDIIAANYKIKAMGGLPSNS